MLGLKYWGIIHPVDRLDYDQSHKEVEDLDKNDFCHHMFHINLKGKEPVHIETPSRPPYTLFGEFEDDKEVSSAKRHDTTAPAHVRKTLEDLNSVPPTSYKD
jgi:hypothetical protein